MKKIFVDTDIVLDLLGKRDPFHEFSAKLFSLADQGLIKLFVSSLSFANLYLYIKQAIHSGSSPKKAS